MREIVIPKEEIFSLISCAEDYGFFDDILMSAFAEWIEFDITDEEIENYSQSILLSEGFTTEDYESVKDRLETFREIYCNIENT